MFLDQNPKIHMVLGLPCPLVVNNFFSEEICDFHSKKELIKQLVSNQICEQLSQR